LSAPFTQSIRFFAFGDDAPAYNKRHTQSGNDGKVLAVHHSGKGAKQNAQAEKETTLISPIEARGYFYGIAFANDHQGGYQDQHDCGGKQATDNPGKNVGGIVEE
jgi:hypothetical protein